MWGLICSNKCTTLPIGIKVVVWDKGSDLMPNDINVNIGNSGEYFVAGELERRGFTVAVPMSNVKDFDILAINRETHNQYAIQVKTTGYKQKKWTLSKKNENLEGDNIFYVFVSLNELDTPEYHIVPSKVVANTIKEEHRKWLETPGRNGQKHNDTNIRVFLDKDDIYYDKWSLLTIKSIDDKKVAKGTYTSLTAYIPRLKEIEYAELHPKRQTGDGSLEKPFQMPFYVYADVVSAFENEVYQFEKEHPEFQLNQYGDILLFNGLRWDEQMMTNADVSKMNGQAVMALILGAIRAERFCDGALKSFFESGCIEKWLNRLQEIECLV